MKTIKAETVNVDGKHYIHIRNGDVIAIPISEDDPNLVKSAFNKLIECLKKGLFEIELEDTEQDLFNLIASEYLQQLNGELKDIYDEMKRAGFVVDQNSE